MKRLAWALVAVSVVGAAAPAWAKKKPTTDDDDTPTVTDDDDDAKPVKPDKPADKKAKAKAAKKAKADKAAADKAAADKAAADKAADKAAEKADDDAKAASGDDNRPAAKKKSAAKDDADSAAATDDSSASTSDGASDDDEHPRKHKDETDNEDFKKQDLNGHDLGTKKKTNEFEKDRFFVDKQDTDATEAGTLVQGSLTSTSMIYKETGGAYTDNATPGVNIGSSASNFDRMFTDLRLQTDFRHIRGGNWDARVDARIRAVNQPTDNTGPLPTNVTNGSTETKIQSGLTGQNEYDLRELWIARNGDRSDVFIGRQFIPDLAGVKIDGIRIDYAQSNRFTLLGFGGLFPLRGSRSITTDYLPDNFVDANGNRQPVGRFTGAGGFGAAYRTLDAYGSFGGVVEAPLGGGEEPRIFATSTGYWRESPKLDLYHFAVIDLIGSNAQASNFTNVSVGANYKPSPRLRLTASYNRVDTDTLSVQAGAFLNSADNNLNFVDNETYLQRLSTNEVRGSASAGLGPLERFELTGALSFKYRPDVNLLEQGGGVTPTTITLKAEEGVEAYASLTDRHSIKDARLALDVVRSFGIGSVAYQHTEILAVRASAAHEILNGRGEWEAEVVYTTTKDTDVGVTCSPATFDSCFGDSKTSMISAGGSVYYRLNRDWMVLGSAYLTRENLQRTNGVAVITDSPVTGLTGFFRISYRF